MEKFLTLEQLEKIADYRDILNAAKTVKIEYAKQLLFLVKFGYKDETKKISGFINYLESKIICSGNDAMIYYLELKVAFWDLSLIIHDKSLQKIYSIYEIDPRLLFRMINELPQDLKLNEVLNDIHFESRQIKPKLINTYICNGGICALFNN
jgi:hypothetical protein